MALNLDIDLSLKFTSFIWLGHDSRKMQEPGKHSVYYTCHCFIGNQRIAGFRGRFQVVLEIFTNRVLQRLFIETEEIEVLGPQVWISTSSWVEKKRCWIDLSYVLIRKKTISNYIRIPMNQSGFHQMSRVGFVAVAQFQEFRISESNQFPHCLMGWSSHLHIWLRFLVLVGDWISGQDSKIDSNFDEKPPQVCRWDVSFIP